MAKWYSLQGSNEPVPLASRVKSVEGKHVSENEEVQALIKGVNLSEISQCHFLLFKGCFTRF